ncbi:MAG TPA: ABC transporter ATP-binding protein [Ktedonobacteraceae bacterium]
MSRVASTQIFTYAARKGPYLSTVGAFLFLCLAEGMVIVFLILHFVPGALLQTLLLTVAALFVALMFGRLLLPLGTSHRVSATSLELRYGLDFHASLPRAQILSARPVQERLGPIPRLYYDTQQRYLTLAFSNNNQVLLRLQSPRLFHFGLRGTCSTDQLLINVDQRAAFLAMLDLPEIVDPATMSAPAHAHSVTVVQSGGKQDEMLDQQLVSLAPRTPLVAGTEVDAPLAIRTVDLTRHYADFVALEKLNLTIRRGEIYGFLGPNGAGKSTAIKMLVGLLQPTSGHAWLAGHDVWREPLLAKGALGYVADRALLYDRLTGREFLTFLAQLRGLPREQSTARINELLTMLDLIEQADRLCATYSFGMKRKLSLAGALLHQPSVLILDEPLNGLDPLSARRLKDLFLHLAGMGTTIFLSTHDLAVAETLCHRVSIIQHGRLLAEGSAAQLRELASAPDLESVFLALTAQEEATV